MTDSGTVPRVLALLREAGYEAPPTQHVAGVEYEFAAVLVATERAQDVVVVVDSVNQSGVRVHQQIESLARRLDLLGSRRSLTVVVVGPPFDASDSSAISRVARLLTVGVPQNDVEQQVADSLAVLLPLPEMSTQSTIDPMAELERLSDDVLLVKYRAVVQASARGAKAVNGVVGEILSAAIADEGDAP